MLLLHINCTFDIIVFHTAISVKFFILSLPKLLLTYGLLKILYPPFYFNAIMMSYTISSKCINVSCQLPYRRPNYDSAFDGWKESIYNRICVLVIDLSCYENSTKSLALSSMVGELKIDSTTMIIHNPLNRPHKTDVKFNFRSTSIPYHFSPIYFVLINGLRAWVFSDSLQTNSVNLQLI